MPISIEEFHEEQLQDIATSADAEGRYTEDAFFDTRGLGDEMSEIREDGQRFRVPAGP